MITVVHLMTKKYFESVLENNCKVVYVENNIKMNIANYNRDYGAPT